ncbi:cysteine desulfurase family protein [Pseudactinotalea sp. Z1739]|uniref:cysteine desulfurase family protein n=1 Tax=Pseudactinotalea sp. Z1739 TaxID=3413028 RepID=UPI003C797B06
MLHLDDAATTPVRREALEAMWPYLTAEFGNPSSTHDLGTRAQDGLTRARRAVAGVLGARASEITFTAGGTEAANLAIKGLALADPRGRHLVTSPIEHEAVTASMDYLVRHHGFEASMVAVDAAGVVRPEALAHVLRPDTTLVSIAYASNEIGTVQDLAALVPLAHQAGALFHTDAVQAAGWLDLDVRALGVDALTISGHKVGAPKGVGAAYLRGRLPVEPLVHGGGQERGRRSGTENVAGAVGLATALRIAEAGRVDDAETVTVRREAFVTGVLDRVPTAMLTGHRERRLPGHASFCFPGTAGEAVLLELERSGIRCSSGSACAAGRDEPSPALLALGLDPDVAGTAVRMTFGASVSDADLDRTATTLAEAVRALTTLGQGALAEEPPRPAEASAPGVP